MAVPQLLRAIQGQGALNADNLNTYLGGANTFAQLRAFIGDANQKVFVAGQTAVSDGYQGNFYYNATSVSADDNVNVIRPNGVTIGAWVRIPTQAIPPAPSAGGLSVGFITTNGTTLLSGFLWTVRTSLGAFSGTLPAISGLSNGNYLEIQDGDYNAGTNNFTALAAGGDTILYTSNAPAGSFVMNVSDTILRLTVVAGAWRCRAW